MRSTVSASCSMLPDSRRFESLGFEPSSASRLSCARAMMGMFSSLAVVLSALEISLTSSARLSPARLEDPCMNCR